MLEDLGKQFAKCIQNTGALQRPAGGYVMSWQNISPLFPICALPHGSYLLNYPGPIDRRYTTKNVFVSKIKACVHEYISR